MAPSPPFCILILLLSAYGATPQQIPESIINRSSSLTPTTNSSWHSPSGRYAFGFYPQGEGYKVGIFLDIIPNRAVIWTANRDDPPVPSNTTLLFTIGGRLVLQSEGEETSIANPGQSASSASITDSGNFMLYNTSGISIWESFDVPTDTLVPGQRLPAGQELYSSISSTNPSTGIFRLKMQHDGNLIQYPVQTPDTAPYSYFTSWTDGSGDNVSLNFNIDGHLFLLNSTGSNIANITPGGYPTNDTIYIFRLDADGLMRLYSYNLKENSSWLIQWSSTDDNCAAKGLCGLNGFCVMNGRQANCRCLPGFDFVQPGNWTAGCERNFTASDCKSQNVSDRYTMQSIANTQWEFESYSVLSLANAQECGKACLEDCNCEAAFFNSGSCSKQRLPLRYGRIALNEQTTALIKVGTSQPTNSQSNNPSERKRKTIRIDILIGSLILAALGCITLVTSWVIICRNRIWAYRKIGDKITGGGFGEDVAPQPFTFQELELVTDGFKEDIGRGAFGTVYKGVIGDSQKFVAVKKLDKFLAEGEKEFQTEVKVIGRTHHKNLVRLIGYCMEGTHRLLVYEYMSNGSLADVLFTPERQQPPWDKRMEIAQDIARGIIYLHEECETQIIHCDIKPQNILMGNCAKISDFGLAKLMKPDQTKTFTGLRGTRGYVAPEWHRNQPVTAKADVYSYGIMLLEIICCRKNVDWRLPENEAVLEERVWQCFETGKIQQLIGDEVADMSQLEATVKVALWCIVDEPTLRPTMKRVLQMLEGSADIQMPPAPAPAPASASASASFLSTA